MSGYKASGYDAAMLLLVLHHVADPVRALTEVKRVLRPDLRDQDPFHEPAADDVCHAFHCSIDMTRRNPMCEAPLSGAPGLRALTR